MDKKYQLPILLALAFGGIVLFACSCASNAETQFSISTSEEIIALLVKDEEIRQYAALEIPDSRNIGAHGDFASFRLFKDQQPVNNGIRAELSLDYPYNPGDTVVYEWDMRIPVGFLSDFPLNRWWVMGQWHDQPNPNLGETWENYPSHSPPVAFYFGEQDGVFYLSPKYPGHTPDFGDLIELPIGDWVHIRAEIRWSQADDGYMRVNSGSTADGDLVFIGGNMLNGYQHYMKVGMYRHPDISTDNTIHLRNISARKLIEQVPR